MNVKFIIAPLLLILSSGNSLKANYVEISKLCPPDSVHKYLKLGGFVLLILNMDYNYLEKIHWLHDKHLSPGTQEQILSRSSQGHADVVHLSEIPETGAGLPSTADRASSSRSNSGRSQNRNPYTSGSRNAPKKKECRGNPYCSKGNNQDAARQKRDLTQVQTNAQFFYVIENARIEFARNFTYGYFLLKLEDQRANTFASVKRIFTEEAELTASASRELQDSLVDFVAISWGTETLPVTAVDLLPVNAPAHSYRMDTLETSEQSLSKCDFTASGMQEHSFKAAQQTKGKQNVCSIGMRSNGRLSESSNETSHEDDLPQLPFKFKGKKLLRQAKQLIMNAWFHLSQPQGSEYVNKTPVQATAGLLNLGKTTVEEVVRQYKRGDKFSNTNKRNKKCPVTDIDEEEKIILYKLITEYYKNNEIPLLEKMRLQFIQRIRSHRKEKYGEDNVTEDGVASTSPPRIQLDPLAAEDNWSNLTNADFNETEAIECYSCCKKSFSRILKKNGYSYGSINHKDTAIHSPYVIHNRRKYLQRKAALDANPNTQILFQDETWLDPHQRPRYGWRQMKRYQTYESQRDFMLADHRVSRGGRIVVLGVGGSGGFVKSCNKVYPVKRTKVTEDYHDNVDQHVFMKWMKSVMENLPREKKHVIIMDNCPFHSVKDAPDSRKNKTVYLTWLREKKTANMPDIPDNFETLTKPALWQIIKKLREEHVPYKLDHMVSSYNNEILRLPQYSPEMNPIEYVWHEIKQFVREKNKRQNINDAVRIAREYMDTYPAEKWQKHIGHCKKVEEMYRQGDAQYESFILNHPQMRELQPLSEEEQAALDEYESDESNEFNTDVEDEALLDDSSFTC